MAARKLQQEVDKCFKKVAEGIQEFESIYEKIEASNNQAQKEKLEDNLKREIKKLQRLRDQIKTWAASNDIKDKGPLLDHRRQIETQMERFKAVEKAMKTKAFSKEGLNASTRLDPKEQAKVEASEFLADQVSQLEEQIEQLEAEAESIQATMKKGKGQAVKADRMAAIERIIERHKWHQGKMELIRRSLDNGGVEPDQVTEIEDSIKYYIEQGINEDPSADDEGLYDDLNLEEEEDQYGMNIDGDKGSSQDAQSVQDEEPESRPASIPNAKVRAPEAAVAAAAGRRPSTQLNVKSPLPTLATMNTPLPTIGTGAPGSSTMKPATLPTRPAGEGLKYASAAAAAAANDKIGIAPLPPPPGQPAVIPPSQAKASATNSPSLSTLQMASQAMAAQVQAQQQQTDRSLTPAEAAAVSLPAGPAPGLSKKAEVTKAGASSSRGKAPATGPSAVTAPAPPSAPSSSAQPKTNGSTNGVKPAEEPQDIESIFHLPPGFDDLLQTLTDSKSRGPPPLQSPTTLRLLAASQASAPGISDAEPHKLYKPDKPLPYQTVYSQYPQEPLPILENPQLYQRIDPDTLFYVFYYKQGTYQQYLAAKALKDQSWRFHKQYQTWFQRHEEPKAITEEFEQGTYRFFDYESTWMNRRKADFRFAYKFLEDDV
ncbi:Not1 N-terminal domain, CCR4-Not complex component-domain-containing protein [Coniochaeta sp. 2T2.1]|nr:Not1 N-terminal domain, CCR4-Not complex component-domain-containing protein [Coniochaeta sp. 2T2.1]